MNQHQEEPVGGKIRRFSASTHRAPARRESYTLFVLTKFKTPGPERGGESPPAQLRVSNSNPIQNIGGG